MIIWNIFSCVSLRPWRKSSPGSYKNRKFSSKWVESQSALTPLPRAGSPSSTRSPASTPRVSKRNLVHTHTLSHTQQTWSCAHQQERLSLCCLALILWTQSEDIRSVSVSWLCYKVCSSGLQDTYSAQFVIFSLLKSGELWRIFPGICRCHHLKTTKVK